MANLGRSHNMVHILQPNRLSPTNMHTLRETVSATYRTTGMFSRSIRCSSEASSGSGSIKLPTNSIGREGDSSHTAETMGICRTTGLKLPKASFLPTGFHVLHIGKLRRFFNTSKQLPCALQKAGQHSE